MDIIRASVHPYALPLRPPLALPGGALDTREGALLRLEDEAGNLGWGDAAPLPGFSRETREEARAALEVCAKILAGHPFPEQMSELTERGLLPVLALPSVSFAFESAALHLRAVACGIPPHRTLSANPAETLQLNALISGPVEAAAGRAAECARAGYTAVKLKAGGNAMREEIARVEAVRTALGPDIALRLDANRAWDFDTAVTFAEAVRGDAIAYIEEPLRDPRRLPEFAVKTGVPYAVDETLRGMDPGAGPREFHAIVAGAAAAVVKPALLHFPGMSSALTLGAIPAQSLVFSAAFESGVGLAAIAVYAAAYGTPGMAVGLDTYRWLENDLLETGLGFDIPEVNVSEAAARGQRPDLGSSCFALRCQKH